MMTMREPFIEFGLAANKSVWLVGWGSEGGAWRGEGYWQVTKKI